MSSSYHGPLRVGVGGPVGSGKTALMDALCKRLRDRYEIAAITNDIYTKWDAEYLVRSGALKPERIAGVETGGCPHTAIREDASANLAAIADMRQKFPTLDLVLIELGGDNLAATFSPELADLTIYVIDVAAGDKIPSKGGPGITRSDLLVINKIDLAPYVGASLETMEREFEAYARRAAVLFRQSARRGGRRRDRALYRGEGRVGALTILPREAGRGHRRPSTAVTKRTPTRGVGFAEAWWRGLACSVRAATCPHRLASARHLPRKRGRKITNPVLCAPLPLPDGRSSAPARTSESDSLR